RYLGVEAQGFVLVVYVNGGQFDLHCFPPIKFAALAAFTVSLGPALHDCFLISDGSQKYAPHIGQEWRSIPRRDRSTVWDMELKVSHCGVRDCAFRYPWGNIVRFSQKR